jgi:hypothetical protein
MKEVKFMQNEINRKFNIGDSFYLKSYNADGQKYTVIGIEDDNRVVFERADSWMFTAVNPVISDDNYVEWDYSVGGRFTDERRVQEHYNKTHSLQKFIDTGKIENIVVYNKYGDFLAEGNPRELRKKELWNLLDEQNAVVKETLLWCCFINNSGQNTALQIPVNQLISRPIHGECVSAAD